MVPLNSMMPILLLLLANLSLQFGAIVAKSLFVTMTPLQVSISRLVIAALLLTVFQRPWQMNFQRLRIRAILIYGLCLAAMNVLFYQALSHIPLGIAVSVEFIGPLSIAIFKSKSRKNFIWIGCAACGMLLFAAEDLSSMLIHGARQTTPRLNPIGLLYALISGTCWAGYILSAKYVTQNSDAASVDGKASPSPQRGLSALGMIIAAAAVLPFGQPLPQIANFKWIGFDGASLRVSLGDSPLFWLRLLGLGVFSSALPYSLEMIALRSLSSASFGVLMSLQPAVAALMAFAVLHESLTLLQWLAILLIIAASTGAAFNES